MDIISSLQFCLIIILILFLLSQVTATIRVVGSWITWCKDIKHLYSLPSPPGRWLSGNAVDVSAYYYRYIIKINFKIIFIIVVVVVVVIIIIIIIINV